MRGPIGLVIEIVALGLAWLVYQKGYGVGPGGTVPMLWVWVAGIALVFGGIMGAVSSLKG